MKIEKACPKTDVGNVGDPNLVGVLGLYNANEIGVTSVRMVAAGGLDTHLAHRAAVFQLAQ